MEKESGKMSRASATGCFECSTILELMMRVMTFPMPSKHLTCFHDCERDTAIIFGSHKTSLLDFFYDLVRNWVNDFCLFSIYSYGHVNL